MRTFTKEQQDPQDLSRKFQSAAPNNTRDNLLLILLLVFLLFDDKNTK